ncbi:hypothetical protein C8R44DRAFT_863592 [Mycena epipterygia]|nr:hypothetical protein C8R44DRAFT_863592 [Mycena epipterygia]
MSETATKVMKLFEVAPRLSQVQFCGPPAALSPLPLEQLDNLTYWSKIHQLDESIPMMTCLSGGLHLRVSFDDDSEPHPLVADVPVVTSQVSFLTLGAMDAFAAERANEVYSHIMAHLALPSLLSMRFIPFEDDGVPLPWPHLAFASLSRRSSFDAHLTFLDLWQVLITEDELVKTLSGLPLLQRLYISDHATIDDKVLITDSLLHQLTWSPDPTCLVPALRYLHCHTLLQFDDTLWRDFVLSRLDSGRSAEGPFEVRLEWYPRHHRELDPVVRAQLSELHSQKQLVFSSQHALPLTQLWT